MKQRHTERIRRETTPSLNGVGSRVPESLMLQAVQFWLNTEDETGSPPSALSVGKQLALSVAPEWLESSRFIRLLEAKRFERQVLALQSRPEIAGLLNHIIDLGMIEAGKRLILTPGEIPNTVLFGDILHKLPKMIQEMTAGAKPARAGDVFVTIVKEISLIQDPAVRAKMRQTILGELERAGATLAAGPASSDEVVDAEAYTIGPPDVPFDDPAPAPVEPTIRSDSDSSEPRLYSDPSED